MALVGSARRAWLGAGALAAVLTAGLTGQLLPTATAAAASGTVRAQAERPPVAVVPSVAALPPAPATPTVQAAAPARPPAPPARRPAAVAAARPAPPAAPTGDVCSGTDWQSARGRNALASLRHPTPAGVTVAFLPARAGYLGLTYPQQHHVDVFVRSCSSESWALLRHVMAHEMGHAYDAAHMTAADRAAYQAMRGIPAGTPWFGCSYCSDFATPAGDFAETYAQWQRGSFDSRTTIAPVPGASALAALAAAFFTR